MRRVVVTGMGAVTPIGNSVEEFSNSVKEEKIGFGLIVEYAGKDICGIDKTGIMHK